MSLDAFADARTVLAALKSGGHTTAILSNGSPPMLKAAVDTAQIGLEMRELSVLETLLLKAGKVVPKQSIIESLAAFDDDLSENALEQYVSRLRRRLAPYALTVRVARGLGYYLDRIQD